jgi:cob(I)alamin adenosyltransferase
VGPPQENQGILPFSRPLILDESLKPRGPQTEPPKGQIIVYTGQGKGKTTAALGLMFRALGHAHQVAVVQFIKGKWPTGERKAAAEFLPELEFHVMGKGFTWDSDDLSQDRRMARSAWDKARQLIETGGHQVVILDEVTYVTNYGFVELREILSCLSNRPKNVSVVLTGRRAHPDLVAMADVVTEMQEIKHPFKSGTKAQKGLDF